MNNHPTREQWLLAAVQLIKPIFAGKNHVVPDDYRCHVALQALALKAIIFANAGLGAAVQMSAIRFLHRRLWVTQWMCLTPWCTNSFMPWTTANINMARSSKK